MTKLEPKVKLHFKLPTYYNNGKPINAKKFVKVKQYFLKIAKGVSIDTPSTGYWAESGGTVYHDETIEHMILIKKGEFYSNIEPSLPNMIKDFKKQFKQLEILCYYHDVVST